MAAKGGAAGTQGGRITRCRHRCARGGVGAERGIAPVRLAAAAGAPRAGFSILDFAGRGWRALGSGLR